MRTADASMLNRLVPIQDGHPTDALFDKEHEHLPYSLIWMLLCFSPEEGHGLHWPIKEHKVNCSSVGRSHSSNASHLTVRQSVHRKVIWNRQGLDAL